MRRSRRVVALLVLAWGTVAFGSPLPPEGGGASPVSVPVPEGKLPDILFITIDTLRADRCSLHGGENPTTAFLEELAQTSIVFDAAYATSSWTPPSMASLFTGLPPRAHGVVNGTIKDDQVFNQQVLSDKFTTFAEAFRAAGYQTFGVSSNAHLSSMTGFAQGFDTFRLLPWQDARAISNAARRLVAARKPNQPLLLWLHYFDPHTPYLAHDPWAKAFGAEPFLVNRLAGAEQGMLQKEARTTEDFSRFKRTLLALYDSEIAYVDTDLRLLFDDLPFTAHAVVAITSDHGEALTNRGWIGHGNSLYDEETRVPLLIRLPGAKTGRRIATPVSNADLYGTLIDLVGLPRPARVDRPSLLAQTEEGGPVFLELNRLKKDQAAVRLGPYKYYLRFLPRKTTELFDLAADPGEQNDISTKNWAAQTRLARVLQRWMEAWPLFAAEQKPTDPENPELIEQLRSLGYVETPDKE